MFLPAFIPGFINRVGLGEWIIILVIVLLLFGARKIPELMKGLGKGVHSFKKGMQEAQDELNRPVDSDPDKDADTYRTGKDRS